MKKIIIATTLIVCTSFFVSFLLSGCAATESVASKSGAQLWGENCNRCHNAPAVGEFTNPQWDIISQHMRVRANLTADETGKIISYLQGTGL